MTTTGTDKQSLQPSMGQGGSKNGNEHVTKSSKRSSTFNNQGSRGLAKSVCLDSEETHQNRRVNNHHNSSQSESESGSIEDLRGDRGEKSPQDQRIKTRSKGGASRRPDGRWQAVLELGISRDGSRNRKYFYGRTKADALAKRDRAKAAIIYGVVDLNDSTNFQDFAIVYIRDVAPLTCKATTVTGYEDLITNHINPQLGHMRLQAIRAVHIDGLMTQMKNSGLSVLSLRAVRRVLSAVLTRAERNDLISSNPVRRTKVPKLLDGDKSRKPVPYIKDQIEVLLQVFPTSQCGTLWKFLLWTGIRRGEALALKWSDLVNNEGQWSAIVSKQLREARLNSPDGKSTVNRAITSPKTKSGYRHVPLDPQMYKELQGLKMRMAMKGNWVKEDDFIFQTSSGGPYFPSNVSKAWAVFLKKHQLRHIQLHGLRHTFATIALSQGAPLESVSEALGHSSIQITKDTYASRVPGLSRKAIEAMKDVMDPEVPSDKGKGVKRLSGK